MAQAVVDTQAASYAVMPTPDELRQVVEILAYKPEGAILIDAENQGHGKKSVDQAVKDGDCFCVVAKGGYVAVDFDQADGVESAERLADVLARDGIESVYGRSGRQGHAHLWAYVPANKWDHVTETAAGFRGGQLRTKNNRMRLPGFKHRSGAAWDLVSHATWGDAIAALKANPDDVRPYLYQSKRPAKAKRGDGEVVKLEPGSAKAKAFKRGWAKGERSEGLLKLAAQCKREGWTAEDFATTAVYYRHGAGEKAHEKANPWKWITDHVWEPADPWKTGHDEKVLAKIEALRRQADAWQPPKRRAGAKATLHKLIDVAEKSGKLEIHASVRETATWTLTAEATVVRHFETLKEAGLIVVVRRGNGVEATVYRLALNEYALHDTPAGTPGGVRECDRFLQEKRAAIYSAGLYRMNVGRLILTVLLEGPATAREVAKAVGRRVSSVERVLELLAEFGLAQESDGVWTETVTRERADQLAKERGYGGRQAEKVRDYQRQLEGYRLHMIHRPLSRGLRVWTDNKIRELTSNRQEVIEEENHV